MNPLIALGAALVDGVIAKAASGHYSAMDGVRRLVV